MDKNRGKKILIVEDDREYRNILSEILKESGFVILEAENGEVGLEVLKNSQVDLILLDIIMPEMDGGGFLYRLKNTLKKDIPVIILTNLVEGPYKEEGTDFVIKANVSLDEIVKKVKAKLQL